MMHRDPAIVLNRPAVDETRRGLLRRLRGGAALAALAGGAALRPDRTGTAAAAPGADAAVMVGSWRLTFQVPGISFATLATFHADGTLVKGGAPAEAAPPGSGMARISISTGHGAWERTSTPGPGEHAVAYTFVELTYDEAGMALGSNVVRGELTPEAGGTAAGGPFRFEARAADGRMLDSATGTVAAQRVTVEPL